MRHVKILAGDDQRYIFPWWFQAMRKENAIALDYVYGLAVHFYADGVTSPKLLEETHREFPNKIIINTESSMGSNPNEIRGPLLGSWNRAVNYILAYMQVSLVDLKYFQNITLAHFQDLMHSVSGWVDRNLILDSTGGPNYVHNYVDSPIITNATSGEIYKQPMFYAIGHFSRFITEGSVRIEVKTSNSMIRTVGFKRPDGNVVLVLFNHFFLPIELIVLDGYRTILLKIPAQTIQSVVYRSINSCFTQC